MTIITTVHKITHEQGAALAIASDMQGIIGGADPRHKEAIVFIILDLDQLVIMRVFSTEGATTFKSDVCQNLFNKVTQQLGIKLGTE